MAITTQEIESLEQRINSQLASKNAQFIMTIHFVSDRLNDPRNIPPITIKELEDIFEKVINNHIEDIIVLSDSSSFNIKCSTSHINMPCAVVKDGAQSLHKNIVVTIMRKKGFKAKKGDVEFIV
ncbi:hypothetical protein ACED63_20435 [Vibrio splendidus]|uniref:hypothetical protein n=1 Tax=Vibrio splendidus TaxID=29497 RepID=UPI00352F565C